MVTLDNDAFMEVAEEKSTIIKTIKDHTPAPWWWLITKEDEQCIVVEFRRIE